MLSANVTVMNAFLPTASSFYKLKRIVAYCCRFIHNCKNKNKKIGQISVEELKNATFKIVHIVQSECFSDDVKNLKKNETVSSKLLQLNPFIDENNIMRVGGRMARSDLCFDAKHQILLPHGHPVTRLIIADAHLKCVHGGAKLTESVLRQRFWVINGFKTMKNVIHKCVVCHRFAAKTMQQLMANLPAPRINIANKPFLNCAVDYTGAISTKMSKGRGGKLIKSYIAIFVCMATKAIHIELVSDMTAEAFVTAFRPLVSRRGAVQHVYSDNGTNFVKANKILMEKTELEQEEYNSIIYNEMTKFNTQWHFSPAGAPHFNGLAEAAVKSVKLHLVKAIGETKLTFEEMCTLLYQIEATVNSRPLCSLSANPNDITVLTPGHFLVGTALLAVPEENFEEVNINWLTRWQLIQKMHQRFWKK